MKNCDLYLPVDRIIDVDLSRLSGKHRVIVEIDSFLDGRIFSLGQEIRRMGYTGKLVALGEFLPDQLPYLSKCGFDQYGIALDHLGAL